jgi:hypothetical protein
MRCPLDELSKALAEALAEHCAPVTLENEAGARKRISKQQLYGLTPTR